MIKGKIPKPLFTIDLIKTNNDEEFVYSVKTSNFVKMIV